MNHHLLLDAEGYFLYFNSSFQTWFGHELTGVRANKLQEYLTPTFAASVTEFLNHKPDTDYLTLPRVAFITHEKIKWTELVLSLVQYESSARVMVSVRDVQQQAEAEQEKIKTSHASFFARHPFGIIKFSLNGQVTHINLQVQTDTGYTLQQLQQINLLNVIYPQYLRQVARGYINAVKHGRSSTCDLQILTSVHQKLDVNFTWVPVIYHDQVMEVYLEARNIAERIALQQNLKKLSLVADKATNGVVVLDSSFKIELINDGFTRMTGFTRQDAIGRRIGQLLLMAEDDTPVAEKARQDMLRGQTIEHEVLCHKKDGTSYWNLLKLTPIMNEQGQMEMCITIHTDITEKKKAETELRLLADDLYRQNKELHQFAYIVSHNMRSPVANIVGLTNLMEVFKDDAETQSQTLRELSKAVNNLDTVIKDLSYILTVNNASKELLKEPVILQDLLQQVLIDLQPQIISTDADIQLPAKALVMRTNRAYLHSIFYNLISNGIKYKSHFKPYIKIDYYLTPEHIVIYVADNGKGIDLNKHGHDLFKPYKRFDFKVEGKGLGLFLVKSHVEALGGHLDVKSEVAKGTTFYLKVPFS
jgi:PAS domain S-box-containing protein